MKSTINWISKDFSIAGKHRFGNTSPSLFSSLGMDASSFLYLTLAAIFSSFMSSGNYKLMPLYRATWNSKNLKQANN